MAVWSAGRLISSSAGCILVDLRFCMSIEGVVRSEVYFNTEYFKGGSLFSFFPLDSISVLPPSGLDYWMLILLLFYIKKLEGLAQGTLRRVEKSLD